LAQKKINEGSGFHQQIKEIPKQLVLVFLFAVVSSSFDLHPRVEKKPIEGTIPGAHKGHGYRHVRHCSRYPDFKN